MINSIKEEFKKHRKNLNYISGLEKGLPANNNIDDNTREDIFAGSYLMESINDYNIWIKKIKKDIKGSEDPIYLRRLQDLIFSDKNIISKNNQMLLGRIDKKYAGLFSKEISDSVEDALLYSNDRDFLFNVQKRLYKNQNLIPEGKFEDLTYAVDKKISDLDYNHNIDRIIKTYR